MTDLDDPGFALTEEEAEYFLHNEHGSCGCESCELFRESLR